MAYKAPPGALIQVFTYVGNGLTTSRRLPTNFKPKFAESAAQFTGYKTKAYSDGITLVAYTQRNAGSGTSYVDYTDTDNAKYFGGNYIDVGLLELLSGSAGHWNGSGVTFYLVLIG